MSLRARLALFIALIVAVAVIAQGVIGYARYHRLAQEDLEHDLNGYLVSIADKLNQLGQDSENIKESNDKEDTKRNDIEDAKDIENERNKALTIELGRISLEENNLRARLLQGDTVIYNFNGSFPKNRSNWTISTLPLPGLLTGNYRLEGAIGLHEYQALEARYRENVLLTVPLMAGLGALLAWILSASALAPLETMIKTASKVAASGNLMERVPKAVGGGELEHLGVAFNKMLERLQSFRERETMFVRYAAHELRTPLAAMKTQFDAQANGWVSESEALTSARNQVERMTRLSQALLLLAREERVEMTSFDLGKLVSEIATKYSAHFEGAEQLQFNGNPILLGRALENLLENVKRHAPNANATVKLETRGSNIILSVEDNGTGLNASALEHATEAFFHSDTSSGSGLGLAVVKRISEAHNGTLKLENLEPSGLKVSLELPLETR
jgi:signal transduction histidine kinase